MASPQHAPRITSARRPRIAGEMVRTRAAAEALRPLLPSFVLRRALDAVTKDLVRVARNVSDQYRAPEALDVVVKSLVAYFFATTRKTTGAPTRAEVRSLLHDAYLAPTLTPYPALERVIDAYTLEGLDADALCSALILLETTHHTKLIWLQANRLSAANPSLNPADLLGWGWQGLRSALRNYDPTSYAFSTYACTRINGAIRDGIRREGPIPKRLTTFIRKVSATEDALAQSLGRAPSLAELAEQMRCSREQLALAARCAPAVSLDARLETNTLGDAGLSVDPGPSDVASEHEFSADLERALAQLPTLEAEAVRLLLIDEVPLTEARRRTGASSAELGRRLESGRTRLAELLQPYRVLAPA